MDNYVIDGIRVIAIKWERVWLWQIDWGYLYKEGRESRSDTMREDDELDHDSLEHRIEIMNHTV